MYQYCYKQIQNIILNNSYIFLSKYTVIVLFV